MSDKEMSQEMIVKETMQGSSVVSYMSVDQVLAQRKLVRDIMKNVMEPGIHYGDVPGCGKKPSLFQAGAEVLASTFRLCPEYEITKTFHDGGHLTVDVVCRLYDSKHSFLGSGVGMATTMESKHRYRNANLKCPACGAETIFKDKKEEGGWYCWTKKGGCGAKFAAGDAAIENQERGKVENADPADQYNTTLKMGKKRSFVDCTKTVLAVSDIYSQDLEDIAEMMQNVEPHTPDPVKKKEPVQKTPPAGDPPPVKKDPPADSFEWTFEKCKEAASPDLTNVIRSKWNSFILTGERLCEIFRDNHGDQVAIKKYLLEN